MEDSFLILGEEFEEVHRFMDSYANQYPPPLFLEYHRKFLHNAKGVKMVKKRFGGKAEYAAKLHLIRDLEVYCLRDKFHRAVTFDKIDKIA